MLQASCSLSSLLCGAMVNMMSWSQSLCVCTWWKSVSALGGCGHCWWDCCHSNHQFQVFWPLMCSINRRHLINNQAVGVPLFSHISLWSQGKYFVTESKCSHPLCIHGALWGCQIVNQRIANVSLWGCSLSHSFSTSDTHANWELTLRLFDCNFLHL